MRNGEISSSDNSKSVEESDSIFMKHKLDIFRTKFNRLKLEEKQLDGKSQIQTLFTSINVLFYTWDNANFSKEIL